jgi:hypothetical protein
MYQIIKTVWEVDGLRAVKHRDETKHMKIKKEN